MPRLIKYNTEYLDNVPDTSLQVIEHTCIFYLVDTNVKGTYNKYLTYAIIGSLWEWYIHRIKVENVE